MQTIVLLSLFVMGVTAASWRGPEYPSQQWSVPRGRPFHWGHHRTSHYQHGFPHWYPQQGQQEQNIEIERSLAEAEWICRNPKTGDVLIVAPQTVDQTRKPFDESTPRPEQEQVQDTTYHEYPSVQTTTENPEIVNTTNHGGEGIIDVRFG